MISINYIFPPPKITSLAIQGSQRRFPVRRIYCVGRNYLDHIREMAGADEKNEPFFFQKPRDAVLETGSEFPYPTATSIVHHEIELIVAIGTTGKNICSKRSLEYVFGYGVGVDMTRRDLQKIAKDMRRPWEAGKSFDFSAPCSEIVPVTKIGHPKDGRIFLTVNGEIKQDGNLADQIWSVQDTISHLSSMFQIMPGDLIMTGTPAGVGSLKPGDLVVGSIAGITRLRFVVK